MNRHILKAIAAMENHACAARTLQRQNALSAALTLTARITCTEKIRRETKFVEIFTGMVFARAGVEFEVTFKENVFVSCGFIVWLFGFMS